MKTGNLVLLGVGVLAVFYLANLGVAGNVLQYYISTVDFRNITTGTIGLVVQNPSDSNITLNSMAGTISANGTTIGNISNFQGGVQIPANQQVQVTITFALSLTALLGGLYSALTQPAGNAPIAFVIAGDANINAGIIVPFNIAQTVNV
jgi:hypothetical protein